jgi:hypothetical protein
MSGTDVVGGGEDGISPRAEGSVDSGVGLPNLG